MSAESDSPAAAKKAKKAAHTPGPWETFEVAHEETPWSKRRVYRVEIRAPQYYRGRRTHSRHIAQIVDYCEWTDHPANAALIAAAPDLLEALEDLIDAIPGQTRDRDWWPDDLTKAVRKASATLAKAKG